MGTGTTSTVCLHAYLRNSRSELHQIFSECCLWSYLDPPGGILIRYVIPFFVDDDIFSSNGSYGAVTPLRQPRWNVAHGLTPTQRPGCVLRILSWTTRGTKARRVLGARGAGSGVCDASLSCFVFRFYQPKSVVQSRQCYNS